MAESVRHSSEYRSRRNAAGSSSARQSVSASEAASRLLPAESLVLEKNKASVFLVADSKVRKVPVKTGFNDGISVEILEGLNPADRVVLLGKQTLTDGQAVRVVEAK